MPSPRPLILILALAIALFATSCGSSDEDGGETTVVLAKAQLITQGDAICRKADKQQENGVVKYSEEASPGDFSSKKGQEELVKAVGVPSVVFELEELQKLEAETDPEAYEAILVSLEEAVAKGEAQPLLLTLGPTKSPFVKANELAAAYGFKDCADFL